MKAIILISGGIDSTVMLALAIERQIECLALSFDYGQRHSVELNSAQAICEYYQIEQKIITINPSAFGNSSLISNGCEVPSDRTTQQIANSGIPNTYVPARNTLFLCYALVQAEIIDAREIHLGMNIHDRNSYPDCRPEFISAFQNLVNVATKQSIESKPPKILTPLQDWNKAKIISEGLRLNAPLELTHSCYNPTKNGLQCGKCDACIFRSEGFSNAILTAI